MIQAVSSEAGKAVTLSMSRVVVGGFGGVDQDHVQGINVTLQQGRGLR